MIEYIVKYDHRDFGRGITYQVDSYGVNTYGITFRAGLIVEKKDGLHFYFQTILCMDSLLCAYVLHHLDDENEIKRALYMEYKEQLQLLGLKDRYTTIDGKKL